MLKLEPDLVVAFPGGKGTQNMIDQAVKAKVRVLVSTPSHFAKFVPYAPGSDCPRCGDSGFVREKGDNGMCAVYGCPACS